MQSKLERATWLVSLSCILVAENFKVGVFFNLSKLLTYAQT